MPFELAPVTGWVEVGNFARFQSGYRWNRTPTAMASIYVHPRNLRTYVSGFFTCQTIRNRSGYFPIAGTR